MAKMEKTFEASLDQLERIVRQLEEGNLSLEDSLKLFEKGVTLSRECRERLSEAERRIEVLLKDNEGNPLLQDLDPASLREKADSEMGQPGIKKRIVFDDEPPF
ncbi:MAG: exodeoxyribonuclease VII small subunit [Pyrinomonadaceae bacterium]